MLFKRKEIFYDETVLSKLIGLKHNMSCKHILRFD